MASSISFTPCGCCSGSPAWFWGYEYSGNAGNGADDEVVYTPGPYLGVSGLLKILPGANGGGNSWGIGLKSDHTLWFWGSNRYGLNGNGSDDGWTIYVAYHILSGTFWYDISSCPIEFAGAYFHAIAIKDNGTLWFWGNNNAGSDGSGTTDSLIHTPTQIGLANDWISVVASEYNDIALKSDGTLWFWGTNDYGQNGTGIVDNLVYVPTQIGTDTDWIAVYLALTYVIAIKTDGTLWFWGTNSGGQNGSGLDDGLVYAPMQIGSDTNWMSISVLMQGAGGFDRAGVIGLKTDGTIWHWGKNVYGENGSGGSDAVVHVPTQIGVANNWTNISGNGVCVIGLKADGTIWFWGTNSEGQNGNGLEDNLIYAPMQIGAATDWTGIFSGPLWILGTK